MSGLAEAGAALLNAELLRAASISGGNLSQIVRIELADGRDAIVKNGPSPRTEAAMLDAIRATGAPAPAVLGLDDETLAIARVPAAGSLSGAWAHLGEVLAALHRVEGDRYGWEANYAFGEVAIVNAWSGDWPAFWGEHRLLVHLPHIAPDLGRRIETLAADLPRRLPKRPRASLLHGDLWGGNILAEGPRITGLIDPACYHGDAEVDLAMLGLFDQPANAFFAAYGPLEPGHADRMPIYQLWPALVHLRLFGSGYRSMVEQRLSDCGV